MATPRKLVAEWRDELENVRVELDLEMNRIIVWRLRHDQEEAERHEIDLDSL